MFPARIEDAVGMAHGILERLHAMMRFGRGPAVGLVLYKIHTVGTATRIAGHEATLPTVVLNQLAGDMPELGGIVLVDEKDVHCWSRSDGLLLAFCCSFNRLSLPVCPFSTGHLIRTLQQNNCAR
jgi:hypothetical protein